MRTLLLFCFVIFVGTLAFNNACAQIAYTWTGGTSTLWSNATNWSPNGNPGVLDAVTISGTGKAPTVDVVSQCASLNVAVSTVVVTLAANLTVTGTLTIQDPINLTIAAGTNQTLTIEGKTTLFGGNTFTINAANTVSLNAVDMFSDNVTNGGTVVNNKTGGTLQVTGILNMFSTTAKKFNTQITNSGTFYAGITGSSCTINMDDFAAITSSGTFYAGASSAPFTLNLSGASCILTNQGTFYASPAGAAACTVNISGNTADLTNSGTFYAGISGTSCTFNITGTNSNLKNSSAGTFFYLAPASVINVAGSGIGVSNSANSVFTIQSDATGSGTIGAISGTTTPFTGNYNVQRYITGDTLKYRGYRLLSSSVSTTKTSGIYSISYLENSCFLTGTTGTGGGFDGGVNPTLYLYRENLVPSNASFISGNFRGINSLLADPSYTIDGDGSGFKIPAGNGFLFFFRGDRNAAGQTFATETVTTYVPTSTTLTENGALNQGAITISDWYTPTLSTVGYTTISGDTVGTEGFNLVGNPYASSIDWDTYSTSSSTNGVYAPLVSGSTGVGPFIYVLDSKSKNYNVYEAGNAGVGTISNLNSNIIPSGQGFFIKAFIAGASLTFNETAKVNTQVTAAQGTLFLGAPPVAAVNQYLHLKLNDSVSTDGILINFSSSANALYAGNKDAPHRAGNGTVSLSSLSADNIALAIHTLPLPKLTPVTIPLKVGAVADGAYQLQLSAIKSIPDLYDIWLMDAYKNDSLDIKHNPAYSFNIYKNDAASFGAGRFSLVIRQNPALAIHLLNFTATKATGGAETVWKTENEQNYTNFTVERSTDGGTTFDVLGGFASSALGTYSFLDKNPAIAADQYRLKIEDLNGNVTYSNVVTLMYANSANSIAVNNISVYPNPVSGAINVSIIQDIKSATGVYNLPNPAYNIMITNSMGSIIKTATSAQTLWQDNLSNLLPGTYLVQVVNANDKSVVGKVKFVKL